MVDHQPPIAAGQVALQGPVDDQLGFGAAGRLAALCFERFEFGLQALDRLLAPLEVPDPLGPVASDDEAAALRTLADPASLTSRPSSSAR